MPRLRRVATPFAVAIPWCLSGLWGLVTVSSLVAAEGPGRAHASPGALVPVLEEFDGVHPNGTWHIHQYRGTFEYRVKRDAMVMIDQRNTNQHLTRRGLELDAKRRYALEARFTIHERTAGRPPNSFCLNFQVAGAVDSFDSVSCWSMNVDVAPGRGSGGVMKSMGFVDGRFRQIGERKVPWAKTGVEYLLRVDVNTDSNGRFKLNTVTVTVKEGSRVRERFEVDYAPFPYQPDLSKPVRVGVNTHGADWTMRDFKVWAEAGSAVVETVQKKEEP